MMIEFPENYTALLEGSPGIGKFDYCLGLLKTYLEKGEKVVYITTEKAPDEIKAQAKAHDLDIDALEGMSFLFIDIYSHSSGAKYEKGLMVDNPANLNLISINMSKAVQQIGGGPVRIFFDSLSTLFLHAKPEELTKFVSTLSSRVKTDYGFILYNLQAEMHDPQTVTTLKSLVDAVLEMKYDEGPPMKKKFRVHHAKGLKTTPVWHTFDLTEEGFTIIEEEEEPPAPEPVPGPAPAPPPTVIVEKKSPLIPAVAAVGVLVIGFVLFQLMSSPDEATTQPADAGTAYEVFETTDLYHMEMAKTVNVAGEDVTAFIDLKNRKDTNAPEKGWLIIETPFYRIDVHLDGADIDNNVAGPHYRVHDKSNGKDITVFNDRVENPIDMLTSSTLGYADLDGENLVSFSSMALHDESGISYKLLMEDKERGFVLINTEGWDFIPPDPRGGYDVEGEVMLGIFADKPTFIDAEELNNLQVQGYALARGFRNPDEIVKDWNLIAEYSSAVIKGGDTDHMNGQTVWQPYYEVQDLFGGTRKSWHAGSTSIPQMFPDHVLIGNNLGGGVLFSQPKGLFRFDESKGIYGSQLDAEFIITLEKPEKVVSFSIEPVNRNSFFYDAIDFVNVEGYAESLEDICGRYGIEYPGNVVKATQWDTKRYAFAVTLVGDWYDPLTNNAKPQIWDEGDAALADFDNYQDIIYSKMESTTPLQVKLQMTP
jgi:KaiC/GvpD/RAD55 family RecA-like ATPase